jgi:hypothetical protein
MQEIRKFRSLIAALVLVFAGIGAGLVTSALPASAAGPCTAFTTPRADFGFQSPIHGGVVMDAVGWGGGGSAANACLGAKVNDQITIWQPTAGDGHVGAGIAADFTPVAVSFPAGDNSAAALACGETGAQVVTTPSKCFELAYTPGNQNSGLGISTITNVDGSFARLRTSASLDQTGLSTPPTGFVPVNQWQDFMTVPQGDGFSQLEAVLSTTSTKVYLNIRGWGGNGTPVIAYQSTGAAQNQIWEQVPAP